MQARFSVPILTKAAVAVLMAGALSCGLASAAVPVQKPLPTVLTADSSQPSASPYDQLRMISQHSSTIGAQYPGIFAGFFLNPATNTVEVGYYSGAPAAEVAAFLESVEAIPRSAPITIVAKNVVAYDVAKRQAMVEKIGLHPAAWKEFFGGNVSGTSLDTVDGTVHVGLDRTRANLPATLPDGSPFVVEGPMYFEFQTK